MRLIRFLLVSVIMCISLPSFCQLKKDSVIVKKDSVAASRQSNAAAAALKDTAKKKVFIPRTAAIRSAILPGLGQAYNLKYWKIPIVYGALGTTALVFRFNIRGYNQIRYAYNVLINKDTANYKNVETYLKPLVDANDLQDLRVYRNEFRKNIDYSVLVFLVIWGLNVVDATVDAHLKGFNVTGDLSLKIKPGFNPGTNNPGLSFVFDFHKKNSKLLALP